MASTTVHHLSSDGSSVARGSASVADGDNLSTGLSLVSGITMSCAEADAILAATNISGGVVTMSVVIAGTPSGGARTVYWEAWDLKKV